MKLPWYMRSKNKGTTIIIPWYGILIIFLKKFLYNKRDVKSINSGFWDKYKIWKE
jgi:hypothetical protein